MSITVTTTTIKTYNTLIADMVVPEGTGAYTSGAIGDMKTLVLDCAFVAPTPYASVGNTLVDKEVIFNPALFLPAGSYAPQSNAGFYIKPYSAMTNGFEYEMALFGNGSYQAVNQNWKCYYVPLATAGLFKIVFEFYLTADTGSFIQGAALNNRDRLLKNHVANTAIMENEDLSVYNMPKQIVCYLGVKFPANEDGEAGTPDTIYTDSKFHTVNVNFRFYDRGLNNEPSELTNFNYALLRNGVEVNELSTYEDTQVRLRVTGTPSSVAVWLIRTDTAYNNKTFYANYEASFSQITTEPTPGVIENALLSPSTALVTVGSEKETTFYIDKDSLDFNGKYRVLVIYYKTSTSGVNSFATLDLEANGYPPGCSPALQGNLRCCNRIYGNYITAAPHDRIKSVFSIDGLDLAACIQDYVPVDLGIWNYFKRLDITLYYEDADDADKRHILEEAYIDQVAVSGTGPYQYNLVNKSSNLDITAQFTTLGDGEGGIETTFRIRQDEEPNVGTLTNGVYSAAETTQQWIGKTIFIEYKLSLYYSNATQPYTDVITFKQKVAVRDYDNIPQDYIESIKLKNISTGNYIQSLAGLNAVKVEVKLKDDVADTYNLLALLDKETFNVRNIIEEETYGTTYLPQLTNNVMFIVSATYNAITKIASFEMALNALEADKKYRIIALAKKV